MSPENLQSLFPNKDDNSTIAMAHEILSSVIPTDSGRMTYLTTLSSALFARSFHTHDPKDLNDAISAAREAISISPPSDESSAVLQYTLAESLLCLFKLTGRPADMQEAVSLHRKALLLRPPGHADRYYSMLSLAKALHTQFCHTGESQDLVDSIENGCLALSLFDPSRHDRPTLLVTLAAPLFSSFKQTSLSSDLDQCIEYTQEAVDCCPPESSARPASLDILSRSLLSRYENRGEPADLEAAIGYGLQGVVLCLPGHLCRLQALGTLAAGLLARFERTGKPGDLERSVTLSYAALSLCSLIEHANLVLDTLVPALIARFTQEGREDDLEAGIEYGDIALALHQVDHPDYPRSLVNLAVGKWTRFVFAGRQEDIEDSVGSLRKAIQLLPFGSTIRAVALSRLADATRYRFISCGALEDLEESVARGQEALSACGSCATSYVMVLNSLASSLGRRFGHTGEEEDFALSMKYFVEGRARSTARAPINISLDVGFISLSLDVTPQSGIWYSMLHIFTAGEQAVLSACSAKNLHRPSLLSVLASVALLRYEESESLEDLEKVFAFAQEGLSLCSLGSIVRPELLLRLANALHNQYTRDEDSHDLTQCIDTAYAALSLCSSTHPRYHTILAQLGEAFSRRFKQTRDPEDEMKSITYLQDAFARCPPKSPLRIQLVEKLVFFSTERKDRTKKIDDIERAIHIFQQALPFYPPAQPERGPILALLAGGLRERFDTSRNLYDLDKSIEYSHEALSCYRPEFVGRYTLMARLASALRDRYDIKRNTVDIQRSIDYGYEALASCPQDQRTEIAYALATALRTRFSTHGQLEDLDDAIIRLRQILQTAPQMSNPNLRLIFMIELAESLGLRFDRAGQPDDLQESIQCGYNALLLHPTGQIRQSALLFLSRSLGRRYSHMGQLGDLTSSISFLREALSLDLTPESPRRLELLTGLSGSLCRLFERTKDPDAFEECILYGQEALRHCTTEQDADRLPLIFSLGRLYSEQHSQTGKLEDLEKAIEYIQEAVSKYPPQSFKHLAVTTDLTLALIKRYRALHKSEDIDECIDLGYKTLSLCPPEWLGHPQRLTLLAALATSLFLRYSSTENIRDCINSIRFAREGALLVPIVDYERQLVCAALWADAAYALSHPSTTEAYRLCFELQERNLAIAPTLEMQHEMVRKWELVPLDAVAYAINQGDLKHAVEMLEQYRALLWSQVRRLRVPLDKAVAADESLGPLRDTFLQKGRALEALSTSSNPFLSSSITEVDDPYGTMLEAKRRLSTELDKVVEQIRAKLPDFLRPSSYDKLMAVSAEGPVIIVNHSLLRSDALILGPGDNLSCVQLSDAFYERAIELAGRLLDARQVLKHSNQKEYDQVLRLTLRALGELVVEPVVEKLRELGVREGSRIWWCPTSVVSALPLHAAGPLKMAESKSSKSKVYLPDLYISSYTPTLAALIDARAAGNGGLVQRKGLLGVALLDKSLEAVTDEVEVLRACFTEDRLRLAIGGGCTREAVVAGLAERPWVHFACHGTLEAREPFNSALILSGGERLTLLDIVKAGLHNAELAILSACHSAEQTQDSATDEVLHLAAAMQFSGFRSVVGTMWQMSDEDGPTFASFFYRAMFAEQGEGSLAHSSEIGFKRAARALCFATKELRRKKVSLERWVNFVHIGA